MILYVTFDSKPGEIDERVQVTIANLLAERFDRLVSTVCLNANPSMGHKYTAVPPMPKNLFPDAPIGFKKEELMEEYYCAFVPLSIFCAFGASNIHHAYNKAAKNWGARPADANVDVQFYNLVPMYRIRVARQINTFKGLKEVSQKEMTAIIKAWRTAQ